MLSYLETGERAWTLDQLENVADALGVEVVDLMSDRAAPQISDDEAAVILALRAGDLAAFMALGAKVATDRRKA